MGYKQSFGLFLALITIGVFLFASFSFFSLYGNKITGAAPAPILDEDLPPASSGECIGIAISCDSFSDSPTCLAQAECLWDDVAYCHGVESTCSSFLQESQCSSQVGCSWSLIDVLACGDGIINTTGGEECDDGNTINGDGCSSICFTEVDWSCVGEPSVCVSTGVPGNTCSDTDNGLENVSVGGLCFNSSTLTETSFYPDACINETSVKKYFCAETSCNFNVLNCPTNYTCNGGGCNLNVTQSNETQDNLTDNIGTLPPGSGETAPPNRTENTAAQSCDVGKCGYGGKCYVYGTRIGNDVCSEDGGFVSQKVNGVCYNHFECKSNICSNKGQCVNWSFSQRAGARFHCIFTGKDCRGTAGHIAKFFGNKNSL